MSKKCPICGHDNGCAFNSGKDPYTCWCMKTTVPKALSEQYDKTSCICKSCVDKYYQENRKKICVIGSLNIDIILNVHDFPIPGETIRSKSSQTLFGGKGGNQAIASKLFESEISLLACLGNDHYGDDYIDYLASKGVNTHLISRVESETGKAIIEVDHLGENKIITTGGANNCLSLDFVEKHLSEFLDHDLFMFSLSNPVEVTRLLMELIKKAGKKIILDPAPKKNYCPDFLDYVDIITPNQTEFEEEMINDHTICVLKRGSKGSKYIGQIMVEHGGYPVLTVDTVGAGDCFNAALAYGYLYEFEPLKLIQFSNAAGALSTLSPGAQTGLPNLEAIFSLKNTLR